MQTKKVEISQKEIVVNRQALLDVVRALDIRADLSRVPAALDHLREPFFGEEMASGIARTDFSINQYEHVTNREAP